MLHGFGEEGLSNRLMQFKSLGSTARLLQFKSCVIDNLLSQWGITIGNLGSSLVTVCLCCPRSGYGLPDAATDSPLPHVLLRSARRGNSTTPRCSTRSVSSSRARIPLALVLISAAVVLTAT